MKHTNKKKVIFIRIILKHIFLKLASKFNQEVFFFKEYPALSCIKSKKVQEIILKEEESNKIL